MRKAKYPLTRQAEMFLAYAEVTNPRFHELLGHAIEADRLANEDAQLLVSAAQEIAREGDQPCASTVAAVQQLRLRVNAGKLTMESLQAANDLLDAVEDAGGIQDLDGLIATVTPAIKRVAHMEAVEQTIAQVGQQADPAEAAERFAAIANLGKARVSDGQALTWTPAQIALAASSTITDPLPTGIPELDTVLGGGIEKRSLGVFLANSGDGKSLALCHVAAESLWDGRRVAYVTLELSEHQIMQRVICNMVDMTPTELAADPHKAAARRSLLDGFFQHSIGDMQVLYMTPKVGTVAQIRQWLKDLARKNFVPDVLLVDYADKLSAKAGEEKGSYVAQGMVYQQLRDLVVDLGCWGWTASQTTGRQGRKKKIDMEDIADSMEKARICDTLVAIVRHDEDVTNGLVRFRLPKRRNGEAHKEVGPLNMDPERGRMVAIMRSVPW